MKSFFLRIVSVVMALLVLASTTSWSVEKHYCMGHMIDMAWFGEADSCGMDMAMTGEIAEKSCCTDEVVVMDGQDNLKLSFEDLNLEHQFFLIAFIRSYIDLFEGLKEHIVPHKEYPPPILVKDLQVLSQVFLI
ncbi:MAG: hypothetical protein AAFO99_10315 [Bacteroidota bacterium]